MMQAFPNKLVHHLKSFRAAEQVQAVQNMMISVLHVADKLSLKNFLFTYVPKISAEISADDQKEGDLIAYLSNPKAFHKHIDKATYLDIKDLVNALQKGVLKQLCCLVQCSQSEVLAMDDSYQYIKKELTSYEWVCQLSKVNVNQLLEDIGQKGSTFDLLEIDSLKVLKLDVSGMTHSSLRRDDVLKLLRYYGVIKWDQSSESKHRVVTFKAANLSLMDILSNYKLLSAIQDSDEIQFLCAECFYIDASIDASINPTWASKNVAIYAPKVFVMDICLINLSGEHGVNGTETGKRKADDGQTSGDHGSHGEHGIPGHSGGNILICTDEIVNAKQLSLQSCGGDGGDGQDGGNGQDGIAKQTASDNLSKWPTDFARFSDQTALESQKKILNTMNSHKHHHKHHHKQDIGDSVYAYSEAPDGVQFLFAAINEFLYRYGFLLSKSKDGMSADGGNAGKGGKGGGGGQAGAIDVLKLHGRSYYHDEVSMEARNGKDGRPGKTGKPGRRALVERQHDHLHVDGAGLWATTNQYHGFINVKSWESSPRTGQLGSGHYYCRHEMSQHLDNSIISDKIGFFIATKRHYLPTKHNRQAQHGKEENQHQITSTVKTKAIDKAAINLEFQLFTNQNLSLQDHTALLQSLENLELTLHEELQELETVHQKQYHKQSRRVNYELITSLTNIVDENPISERIIIKEAIPFEEDDLKDNPLISLEDKKYFLSNEKTLQDKYVKVRTIIQSQLDALQPQMSDESAVDINEHSRFEALKMMWKQKKLDRSSSDYICRMLSTIFVPVVQVMHFEHTHAIDDATDFITTVQAKCHSQFHSEMDTIKSTVDCLLFKQYRWCILAEIHDKHIAKLSVYQSKSVTVYLEICKLTTVRELKVFASSLDNEYEIPPYPRSLPPYSYLCDVMIPLRRSTKKALELLMIFINENNSNSVYIPDILSAVQEEYATFCCTINDLDLQFVMNYLQEKLLNLMNKTQLEYIFCSGLLSKLQNNTFKKHDFIIYYGQTYQISIVSKHLDDETTIIIDPSEQQLQSKTHQIIVRALAQVTVDGILIDFPDDELLVSPVDINKLWSQLQVKVMKGGRIPPDKELEGTLSLLHEVHDDHKDQLLSMLQKARSAQDIPYDILSFYLPSQWVEQLILYTIRTQYEDQDPNLVVSVQEAISGLSRCVDKTVYFTFFDQFLMFEAIHYGKNILEVLQIMKPIFIDRQLCTIVTEQGISIAWPKLSAKVIISDLQDTELIDDAGIFLSNATLEAIETYCRTRNLSPGYLRNIYNMQQYCNSLTDKEISFWIHKLHELHLLLDIQDMIVEDNIHDHNEVLMYAQMLVQHYGNNSVSNFMSVLKSRKENVPAALLLDLLKKCATKEWIFEIVVQELTQKASDPLTVILSHLQKYPWKIAFSKSRSAIDLVASIKSQFSIDLSDKLDAIITNIHKIKNFEIERKHSSLIDSEEQISVPICEYKTKHIRLWVAKFRKAANLVKQDPFDHELVVEAFAVIRRGITIFYGTERGEEEITPRDTQMVASLLFLQNLSVQGGASQGTRLMQQISTGEGKTMIICMTAIFKALLGEKVDIVTSSSVLATRDAADQKGLYSLFNISVSHCCHEDHTKRCQAYESDVVYGDIGSFQRDILETDFYGHMIRTSHGYDNVFIDEVDSMLVDKGESMLYLPHALPDLNALHGIYLEIWSLVNAQDFLGFPDEQDQLHDYLKHKLFGGLCTNAFTAVSGINEEQSMDIHRRCIDIGLIDRDDHCLTTKDGAEIRYKIGTIKVISPEIQQEILLIIQEYLELTSLIQALPKVIHSFVKKSLKVWIQSAVSAKYFHPNREYIIDIDRRESAADRYPRIIIMDNETGVEQESSEWGSGLHQFLQLKHNLRLSTESLIAVYMSNISFFTPRYANIMGVTGTLGSTAEYALFRKLYEDTELVVLPTNKPSRLSIDPPKCCSTTESWEEAIYTDVQEKLIKQKRAVLLICEDVERARYLNQYFKTTHQLKEEKMKLYISSHQQKLEETGEIEVGQLIIATNLAGRGTDIKLSDFVKENGGLHVCLSYLPPNVRVEQQAYGRAARSGDPGSCKMIFHDKGGDLSYAIRQRDVCEAQRVADLEDDYYHNIKFQEELFKKFSDEYNAIKNRYQNKPEGRPELDHCLDCWAYFLDRYNDTIQSIPKKMTNTARKEEKERISRAFDREVKDQLTTAKMLLTPARLMQQGHTYMKQAVKRGDKYEDAGNEVNYKKAVEAFKKARDQNPGDPFARYYEAAAQLNEAFKNKNTSFDEGNLHRHQLKQTFYQLIPLFRDKIKQCQTHITTLEIANRHQDQSLTGDVHYFAEQKQHEIEVYHQYIESMQNVIGHDITPNIFDHVDWGEEGAVAVFKIVKGLFSLKECRISPRYPPRLKALLQREPSYHTFESVITKRIQSLSVKKMVMKDDFKGVFPDKLHFWNQLKKHHLITHDSILKGDTQEKSVGLWNPTIDIKGVQFDSWDCVDANSFDWIFKSSNHYKIKLIEHLKEKHVLNSKGQLIDFDLSKPLNLPEVYTPYYKHIKDTLWNHSIYRFVLDHLQDNCVVIDMENDIDDSSYVAGVTLPQQQIHVVGIIISMNPAANASYASDIQHLQHSANTTFTSDFTTFTLEDHIPNETLNKKFVQQLHSHNLRVTEVSGDGLNCLIHAMIQHAKQEYHIHYFKEADEIRKCLQQKHPDMTCMLHADDHYTETILQLVNDCCYTTTKIRMVSVVIASSDGPIIYGGTGDERFPTGRHVVIWQQGNHYASIVHHSDLVQAVSKHQIADHDVSKITSMKVPKLTTHQLVSLLELAILKTNKNGNYEICAAWEQIELTLQSADSRFLTIEEKGQIRTFLRLKLEIDFKTLVGFPRQLLSDQYQVLYEDLCQYAVIKPIKIKESMKHIEQICHDRFGYKSQYMHRLDKRPYFDCSNLNEYLKQKNVEEINDQQQKALVHFLESHSIITLNKGEVPDEDQEGGVESYLIHLKKNVAGNLLTSGMIYLVDINELTSDHSSLLHSATFLREDQQVGVKDYLKLMINLKENVSTIISTLRNQLSTILELETPEITLRQLPDVFHDDVQEKGDVLEWFSNNQCHLVIDLGEQKWSWPTISTGFGAIALGVAQITLGAVLLLGTSGTGSFFCNALISEGVSDMIFGIEGLVKGQCNWSQYWDNKKMSLAITVATAGVGALFARGREASRYAYKAFGNASKQIMKATAKQTGKSVSKVMAREVGKKIGKKVAGAVADAGINLATDLIVNKLSQVIDSMSESTIDAFDNMCQDQDLRDTMSQFLQHQCHQNAGKRLHQIAIQILQQQKLLEIWDTLEGSAKMGANVLTEAHRQATSHLAMCGKNLRGQRFMKGIATVSRFAPYVTEILKSGMIIHKMNEVKEALKCDLKQRIKNEQSQSQLNETKEEEIKKMVDQEISAIKYHLSQEVSQRGKKVVRMGLQMVGQKIKSHAIELGKKYVGNLREHMDITQLRKYEQKLEEAKSDQIRSRIKKYEGKLQRLMTCTRSPKVFAHMIEHGALLGPAFAVPALEKFVNRPIRIVSEDGRELLNVQHHAEGTPIEIKFIPGKGDTPGHYYLHGKEKYAPQQHGNNCLIHAVLAGAGKSDVDADLVRSYIAEACLDLTHPCHDYIERGIARNYVHIGLVGGTVKFEEGAYSGKATWYNHMNDYLLEEWKHMHKEKKSGIDINEWTFANGGKQLTSLGLDRCHRISETSIQGMIEHAIKTGDCSCVKDLREYLLPTLEVVERGDSFFQNEAKEAFLKTCNKESNKERYMKQIERVDECISNWEVLTLRDVSDQLPKESVAAFEKLARDLSNSPINVSLGDASTNRAIGKAMDYTPGSPRSEGLRRIFFDKPGFHPPKGTFSSFSKLSSRSKPFH